MAAALSDPATRLELGLDGVGVVKKPRSSRSPLRRGSRPAGAVGAARRDAVQRASPPSGNATQRAPGACLFQPGRPGDLMVRSGIGGSRNSRPEGSPALRPAGSGTHRLKRVAENAKEFLLIVIFAF